MFTKQKAETEPIPVMFIGQTEGRQDTVTAFVYEKYMKQQ